MPVPGRKCPCCLAKGETVWVVSGKCCPQCGTPVGGPVSGYSQRQTSASQSSQNDLNNSSINLQANVPKKRNVLELDHEVRTKRVASSTTLQGAAEPSINHQHSSPKSPQEIVPQLEASHLDDLTELYPAEFSALGSPKGHVAEIHRTQTDNALQEGSGPVKLKEEEQNQEFSDDDQHFFCGICGLETDSWRESVKHKAGHYNPENEVYNEGDNTESTIPASFSSNASLRSVATSSTMYSTQDLLSTVEEFTSVLLDDSSLRPVYESVFGEKSKGPQMTEQFTRVFRRLLKQYACDLEQEGAEPSYRLAAHFIGSQSRSIASSLRQTFDQKYKSLLLSSKQGRMTHIQPTSQHTLGEFSDSEEENAQPHLSSITNIKPFLVSSKAYHDLRTNIHRFVDAQMDNLKPFEDIREVISRSLSESDIHDVNFSVHWDLDKFCTEELGESSDLCPVIVVSGSIHAAYATHCQEYVERYWPGFGLRTLHMLGNAIKSKEPLSGEGLLPGRSNNASSSVRYASFDFSQSTEDGIVYCRNGEISGSTEADYFHVDAVGSKDNIIELAELLSWLACVFRPPVSGYLSYSRSTLRYIGAGRFELSLSELLPIEDQDSACWCPMFRNSVIAQGFPTPDRQYGQGLELSFEVMLTLGRVWYPMEHFDGIVLKGRCTILVPTEKEGNTVQWHFIESDMPIGMDAIAQSCLETLENVDIDTLRASRTFLGYCENAQIHAGTQKSGYQNIRLSHAPLEHSRTRLARELTPSAGSSGCGFFGAGVSGKLVFAKGLYGIVQMENALLEDRLLNSKSQPSLVFDTETRRGWLLPELSVILMIAHVWATKQHDKAMLLSKLPFAEPTEEGANAAYQAILAKKTTILREACAGNEELPLMLLLKNFFTALESRKELVIQRMETTTTLPMVRKAELMGWELLDIATSKYLFRRKTMELDKATSGLWYSIPAENCDVAVLFCQGVEELIHPSPEHTICKTWCPMPHGRDLLMTTAEMILAISENLGGSEAMPMLTAKLYINNPHGRKAFRACNFDRDSQCIRVQDLANKIPSRSSELKSSDAVILGNLENNRALLRTCRRDDKLRNKGAAHEDSSYGSHLSCCSD